MKGLHMHDIDQDCEHDEAGMTTAELLGNAALGVLALVVIWGMLQALGVDIVNSLRDALVR